VFVDILIDDHLGRPNPDCPNLHEWAEKGRYLTREFVCDWGSIKAGAAMIRAGMKLFPRRWGVYDETWGPMDEIMLKSLLKLFYPLRPRRKGVDGSRKRKRRVPMTNRDSTNPATASSPHNASRSPDPALAAALAKLMNVGWPSHSPGGITGRGGPGDEIQDMNYPECPSRLTPASYPSRDVSPSRIANLVNSATVRSPSLSMICAR